MTSGAEYDPHEHAEQLGVHIVYGLLRTGYGLWVPDRCMIILLPRMRVIQERSVLAHECAHAALAHRDNRPKHEVLADRYAAEHLIDHARFGELVTWIPDAARLSLELGVTTKLMQVYLNVHGRELGDLYRNAS